MAVNMDNMDVVKNNTAVASGVLTLCSATAISVAYNRDVSAYSGAGAVARLSLSLRTVSAMKSPRPSAPSPVNRPCPSV